MADIFDLPPLIADTDKKFRESLLLQSDTRIVTPEFVDSIDIFESTLKNPEHSYCGIFVNPNLINPLGIPAIKLAHESRPNTPVFFILDSALPEGLAQKDLEGLGVKGVLKKPFTPADIHRVIHDIVQAFDAKKALNVAKSNADKLEMESGAKDEDFTPILAKNFISGATCFFDVYVRLGQNKYIKVLQGGDAFMKARLDSYLAKGLKNFHLRKEAQAHYLKFCDHIATQLVNKSGVPIEAKASYAMNLGQETLSFMSKTGITQESIGSAESFATSSRLVLDQMKTANPGLFDSLLGDLATFEHGVGASMIASLLAGSLGFEAEKAVKTIGVATLVHDLALAGEDNVLKDEDESKMTPEQIKIFHEHPLKGSGMLAAVRGMDAAVAQAVAQHHERRSRKGFPSKLGSGQITRVAEIVGIADEFMKWIKISSQNKRINPFEAMELNAFNGFSTVVIEAFRKAFKR